MSQLRYRLLDALHWKLRLVMISCRQWSIVITTTSGATSVNKIGIMAALGFQCEICMRGSWCCSGSSQWPPGSPHAGLAWSSTHLLQDWRRHMVKQRAKNCGKMLWYQGDLDWVQIVDNDDKNRRPSTKSPLPKCGCICPALCCIYLAYC